MILDLMQYSAVGLSILGNLTLVHKLRVTFIIWFVANILQGVVEACAHLWGLAALQLFFLMMNVVCWRGWK